MAPGDLAEHAPAMASVKAGRLDAARIKDGCAAAAAASLVFGER
jgi:hypothetical protein